MQGFTFLSIRTQQLSLVQEKKKRPLVLKFKENGHARQVSLCGGEELRRPGQPDGRPAVQSPPGACTQALLLSAHRPALSLSHGLKYFRQNTSNFLFLKLSCISNGIPSNPGERQDKPAQSERAQSGEVALGYLGGHGPFVTPSLFSSSCD